MDRILLIIGSISALIAVAAGAFGAHGLKHILDSDSLAIFEIGVRYQMYHALALIGVAWASTRWPSKLMGAAGWSFAVGTVLFSGSLYVLSLTGVHWLGAVTPVGGVAFVAGWASLAVAILRAPQKR